MKLLMARHGQSEWQVQGDVAGRDSPLTALGERQAHSLGEYLAETESIEALYASNLVRARRTAEIVAGYLGVEVEIDDALREFEDWESGWAPLPAAKWESNPATEALMPGYAEFRRRVKGSLRRIVENSEGRESVLIVAHGGTLGTVWRILLGSDTPRIFCWNAALHAVEWIESEWGDAWRFHYLNRVDYLPADLRSS